MESPTRYSQLLLCVHLAIPDNICPEKNGRLNQMKKKKNRYWGYRGVMRITDLITQDEFAWYFINFPPTTPAGDEKGQQITISILIVGFKGLSSAAEWTHYGLRTRYSQLLLCVKSHYGSCLCTPRYYRQQLSSKKTDVWMKKKRNRYWGYRHFW